MARFLRVLQLFVVLDACYSQCSILGSCGTCTSLGPTCGWKKATGNCVGGTQDQADDGSAFRVRSNWAYRFWLGESLCSKW